MEIPGLEIRRVKFLQKSGFKKLFAVSPFLFGKVILTGESYPYWFFTGSNLPVLFGIYVSQTALISKLGDVNKYDSITMKPINSMQYIEFVVGTFNNSQIITELKFQTGGHLSSVALVTSRMLIKPMVPHGLLLFQLPLKSQDSITGFPLQWRHHSSQDRRCWKNLLQTMSIQWWE